MKLGLSALLSALLLGDSVLAAVMSIDFGTEWMKIGLVKPRVPFDVVLNRDSKRKTPITLNFRNNQRTIGANGVALGVRFPADTFEHLKLLLGQDYNSEISQEYRVNHPNRFELDQTRNSTLFVLDDKHEASVEELTAMFFNYAKQEAETTASEKVKDVVITVPAFFNQVQRQAIIDAASIAELNLLALINDGSAAALNYAMTRQFPTAQTHALYDMGSGNTVATIAKFETVTVNSGSKWKKNVTYTDIQVLGVGYDKTLGGMSFDQRVEQMLLKEFNKKYPNISNLKDSPRSVKKLVKEANRVKHILSANTQVKASIESLHEEKDFSTLVTRTQFESECKDLFSRVHTPLKTALENAKIDAQELDSVVIIGGGVRVPKVQAILKALAGDKLSQNLNGDEAMVMGALFHGASISSQFQVKDVRLTDVGIYPIDLAYSENGGKQLKATIYDSNAPINQAKVIHPKVSGDFDLEMDYTVEKEKIPLFKAQVKGLTEANSKYQSEALESKVKVFAKISPFGTAKISHAKAIYTLPPAPEPETTTTTSATEKETESADSNKNKTKEEPVTPKNVTQTVRLDIQYESVGLPSLSSKQLKDAKDNVARLNKLDSDREALDEARNNLESFGYGIGDFLEQSEVISVSTSEERDTLTQKASEAMEWLEDFGHKAALKELRDKYASLNEVKKKIVNRKKELSARPKAVKKLEKAIETTQTSLSSIPQNLTSEQVKFIGSLEADVQKYIKDTKDWLNSKVKAQEKLESHEEAAFKSSDLNTYVKQLENYQIQILTKILTMPKAPEPETQKENDTTSESDKETPKKESKPKEDEKLEDFDEEEEL
ncbi:actin-like ATPase domain-containing protein [Conidiobolus coronatus NRRL 28638]|uniref:Actin-like ATPase domain-containing protein n=1 Tax=Conidiobolus coronatus (strain ATCC 28846 / CBS 209.66 / NRRL 28638) TaxID=796925 RepID=A0A137PD22_CONC2|nr:actin-like ATPase domain-containing protein [Conidiobolus coronatus NRRL 28638]|eukprot:KXN72890.1 actin-like ATPase domain-containing protein [Conidiobolus coronatus NRRL 28638]